MVYQNLTFLIGLLMTFSIYGLHFQSSTNVHMLDFIHFQQSSTEGPYPASEQQVQAYLDNIENELGMLENTYQQLDSLQNSKVIGPLGSLIQCKNVSAEDQSNIKHSVENVQTDQREAYFELKKLMSQNQTSADSQALRAQLVDQYSALKQRQQALKSKNLNMCPPPDEDSQPQSNAQQSDQLNSFSDGSDHVYINHLNANQNWIYGDQTKTEYESKEYQTLLKSDVKLCPEETPFVSKNGQECIKCQQGQVYDLLDGKCSECKDGTSFNSQSHLCASDNGCSQTQIYNKETDKCQCPPGSPYLSDSECVSCFIPHYWNQDSKKCEKCPKGKYYSLKNEQCQSCQIDEEDISSRAGCHNQCTLKKPHFDGSECVECKGIYNFKMAICQECPDDKVYDSSRQTCQQAPDANPEKVTCGQGFNYNQANGQCIKQEDVNCPETYIFDKIGKRCRCPDSLPHDTGSQCVTCKPPTFWNQQITRCSGCSGQQYYDYQSSSCVSCPSENPHLDTNGKCGPCPKNTEFNEQNGECVMLDHYCPQSYNWNEEKKACVCPPENPIPTEFGCKNSCPEKQTWSDKVQACVAQQNFIDPTPIDKIPVTSTNGSSSTGSNTSTGSGSGSGSGTGSGTGPSGGFVLPTLNICKFGQKWSQTQSSCVCAAQYPHKTDEGCVQCYSPMKWSVVERRCVYSSDIATGPSGTETGTNSSSSGSGSSGQCKGNFIYNCFTNECVCPKDLPFNSGTTCVSCYLPMYWNYKSQTCNYCPEKKFFNTFTRNCEFCPSSKPLLVNNICQKCPVGQEYRNSSGQCQQIACMGDSIYSYQKNECLCSMRDRPFYNGMNCVKCFTPNRWDIASRTCISGYNTTYFSNVTVQKYIENLTLTSPSYSTTTSTTSQTPQSSSSSSSYYIAPTVSQTIYATPTHNNSSNSSSYPSVSSDKRVLPGSAVQPKIVENKPVIAPLSGGYVSNQQQSQVYAPLIDQTLLNKAVNPTTTIHSQLLQQAQ